MGQITSQLGQLFVQSIPTIVLVLFLVVFLKRLFFRPLSRTLEAREQATTGALKEARQQADRAEAKWKEYEKAIHAARQDIYHRREEARHKFVHERDSKIQAARGRAEAMVNDAQADLEKQTTMAKTELAPAVDSLAAEMTVGLFAPHISGRGPGGAEA